MAWVTTLGPDMQQVEYRLSAQCGCDRQVTYRLGAERDLEWIGNGLRDVGLVPGEAVDPDAARALMSGRDPRTSEQLVRPKMALHPKSKIPARPLADAIAQAAAERGTDTATLLGEEKARERFDRMVRGIRRDGEAHRLPLKDAAWLAEATGVELEAVYDRHTLAEAVEHDGQRVRVGNRGYDLTLDLPKSFSALFGVADDELAAALEATFLQAAREAVGAVEDWAGYAMAGHHGNGQSAERVATSGVLGWMTVHRSARPVEGQVGDPHLHVHVALANMVHAEDGKWRTVAAGGRDLHRHAHAADAAVKARLRQLTAERFGMRWERDADTGAWEVVGVDGGLRQEFSRRSAQIAEHAAGDASSAEQKLIARQLAEGKDETIPAADVRAAWRQRAESVVADVDAMVARAAPGPGGPDGGLGIDGPGGGPRLPDPGQIAAHIWRDEDGLCAHRKVVTRADVLAAVIDACPEGIRDIAQAQALTDAVLAAPGHAVRLPDAGGAHLTHAERYTHASIAAAETVIAEQASARLDEGTAQLTGRAAEMALAAYEARGGFAFSAEQRATIARLLTAGHGTDWVIGGAGTGKTTLMDAARSGWEAAGLRVAGASTAAVAAANLAAEAGIPSRTVAAWTQDISGGQGLAGVDVLVVDEGAMVDDRAWAVLLEHAAATGTKIVGIGDPLQLKAIGVGGGFQRAHDIVGGPLLLENRRQRDVVERAALAAWRDGGRATALAQLAEHGRVHAVENATDALSAMVAAWDADRVRWDGDPHGQIDGLLMLAARSDDVAVLNAGARAARQARGELGPDHTFALGGGERLQLAAGDLVRVRRNDYRTRRGGDVDVLNGYRGLVTYASPSGVRVEWMREDAEGRPHTQGAWIGAAQIAAGALSHGYAMTAAAAQGLTADRALVYGVGADAHTLYSAITRDREATHLWLPLEVVESEETRRALGEAHDGTERLHRAVAAYAKQLEADRPDGMVTDELLPAPRPAPAAGQPPEENTGRSGTAERAPEAPRDRLEPPPAQDAPGRQRATERPAAPQDGPGPGQDGEEVPHWRERDYGHLPTAKLLTYARAAQDEAERTEQQAATLRERAEELGAVLGTERSPARQQAATYAHHLDRAVAKLTEAQEVSKQIAELYETNREQLHAERLLRERAATKWAKVSFQRGRLTSDADALHGLIEERVGQIDQLRERMTRLFAEASEDSDKGRPPGAAYPRPLNLADRLDELQRQRDKLPELTAKLERADRTEHRTLQQDAQRKTQAAAELRDRAQGLRGEAGLREGMTPQQTVTETAERRQAAEAARRQQAERQARIREAADREARNRSYDPPSPGRSGPSLGL